MKLKSEVIGGVVTAIYLVGVAFLVYLKRDSLQTLELNAIGDFLAGVFGPVAFLWLVLGYMQQGRELQLSSRALQSQADELKSSVTKQDDLVKVINKSLQNYLQSLEPLLQLKYVEHGNWIRDGVHFLRFEIDITNYGAYCERLLVTAFSNSKHRELCELSSLGRSSTLSFSMEVYDFDKSVKLSLTVNYFRADGLAGSQKFEAEVCFSEGTKLKIKKIG
ncbi:MULTISPECIES: hypothetical protein [Pseudomonas]|uniref:hypothetical protein n=1 Tax=Pseudomonas TaxID=286 RepID=UPI001C6593D8|nr:MULTISPECIES: hypothetical protein [unclassified Pseudomonas]MBW8127523.1 hypothetical protein [Pseudomonas sp. LAP_36]MBW8139299.1 hypothetical protein [Pseudomonas sp. PAMC 26818]